jgi:enoyl-[acyl-carrier protein] reductase II
MVKGDFTASVEEAENRGASAGELRDLLGKGRTKQGIFEGDLKSGQLEIGQIASLFRQLQSVDEVMNELIESYQKGLERLKGSF